MLVVLCVFDLLFKHSFLREAPLVVKAAPLPSVFYPCVVTDDMISPVRIDIVNKKYQRLFWTEPKLFC